MSKITLRDKKMKKSMVVLSFIFSVNLLQADNAGSTTEKMKFIFDRIAAFDERGVEQVLQHTPFTQREIDACIEYIEKHGADLIDPRETERWIMAWAGGGIICMMSMNLPLFEETPPLKTLACIGGAASLFLHTLVSYGNAELIKNKLVKLIKIARRLLAYKPQSQAELLSESA